MTRFSWRGMLAATLVASSAGLATATPVDATPIPSPSPRMLTWDVGAADTNALNFGQTFNAQTTVLLPAQPAYQPAMEGWDVGITVLFPVTAAVKDPATGLTTSVSSAGGIQVVVPRAPGISSGGTITLSNWAINAVARQLSADIAGTHDLPSQSQVAVFALGDPLAVGGNTRFSLWLTEAGADAFAQAAGLQSMGLNVLNAARGGRFGTIAVDVAMVPEPATSALALLGGALVLARLRRRSPHQEAGAQPA